MLTIDGLLLPVPASLRVSYESVGRRETTADGSLTADRLALKRQAQAVWRGLDRAEAAQTLPTSNVIEYRLEGDNKVIFRPSGTEPKVKAYLFAKGTTRAEADAIIAKLSEASSKILS